MKRQDLKGYESLKAAALKVLSETDCNNQLKYQTRKNIEADNASIEKLVRIIEKSDYYVELRLKNKNNG